MTIVNAALLLSTGRLASAVSRRVGGRPLLFNGPVLATKSGVGITSETSKRLERAKSDVDPIRDLHTGQQP